METNPAELVAAAEQHITEHNFEGALEALDQAIEIGGLTPDIDLIRAEIYIGLERFGESRETVRNLLEQGGDWVRPGALLLKARALRRASRYVEDGLEAALDAATLADRRGEDGRDIAGQARIEAARLFARKRCRKLAERELDLARKALGDDDPRVGYNHAAILMDFDERPEARKILEKVSEQGDLGKYLGLSSLAHLEFVVGEFSEAHAHLDALDPLPPGALWPRRIRAHVYEAQQDWEQAAKALDEVRKLSPQADSVWRVSHECAMYLYHAGRVDSAVELCKDIASHAPEDNYFAKLSRRMFNLLSHPEAQHRPKKRLKEFPSVSQLRDHCGPASCELYLRFFGLSRDQIEIAREIKRPDGGTPVYRMRRYLDQAGFVTRRLEAELADIKKLIDAGFPVIMEESYSSSSHVAVAIGYDDALEMLEVQDPMTHRVRETFYEDLTELRNLSNHGALVAAPKDDDELVRTLDSVGGKDCRYMALVDEAWKAYDDERFEDGDKLVAESIELHREYELAWFYRFRRARNNASDDPTPENRVELHRVLGEITALWPDDEWPQQMLGQVLFFDDRVREALVAFERARDRDPGDPYNWSMIGDCHIRMGNKRDAYEALIEALARDPSFVRGNENLADLCRGRGEMTLAWELNDSARELNPDNYFNHAVFGELLEKNGDNDDALVAYDKALEIDAERDWVTVRKSRLLAEVGRVDDAVASMTDLCDRRPGKVDTRIDFADLLYNHGRGEDAVNVCTEIQQLDPKMAAGYSIMGAAQAKLGRLDEALENFDKALEIRPIYTWVYSQKARFLMDSGRTLQAIQSYAAALGMSGYSPRCEYDLGDALVRAGYADEGVRHLRSAAIHGSLEEEQLCRIGELIVDTRSGNVDSFFRQVESERKDDLKVLRAHARTMLEVLWAPAAGAEIVGRIQALSPSDPYAVAARGEDLLDAGLDTEAEGEALLRAAVDREPTMEYGHRVLGAFLVDRGRFEEALEVLEPCSRNFHNDRLRVKAHLGAGDFDGAQTVIDAFGAEYDKADQPGVGSLQLSYLVARRKWDWEGALDLAESISREMHERDDDGRLDRWEEERFECMARMGQVDRALRFGEAQAVDGGSLGALAYTAFRAHQMDLALELAGRALRLRPDESQAIAVIAHSKESHSDIDGCIATWQRMGEIDPTWHVWQEQIARVAIGTGDVEMAAEYAEAGVKNGHRCPWSFSIRAQVRVLEKDLDGARADMDRAWAVCPPELRDNEGQDAWAVRAALSGDTETADKLFEEFLALPRTTDADKERIARVRAAL